MNLNDTVLDMIILYVRAIKENRGVIIGKSDGKTIEIHNAKYLLNQTIRQVGIPKDKYMISEAAQNKWAEITDESIEKYFYQEKVVCTNDGPITIDLYRGNEKESHTTRELKKGDSFNYREVFSNEHMIPVSMLIDKLISFDDLSYKNILETLDSIHICRLLKSEDKRIKRKSKRSLILDEVIRIYYEGITIVGYKY